MANPVIHSNMSFRIYLASMLQIILFPIFAMSSSIDEDIVKGSKISDHYNNFYVNSNNTVDILRELDVLMSVNTFKKLYGRKNNGPEKRNAIANISKLWKDGYIGHAIETRILPHYETIKSAMEHWETYTCIKFTQGLINNTGLLFMPFEMSASYVGHEKPTQYLLLDLDGISKEIVIHELGHAIGLYHEHVRPDRDSYINITLAVFSGRVPFDFEKMNSGVNNYGIPYDYWSIMHYKSLGIITTLDPAYQNIIGNNVGLSFKDIKIVNLMYDCSKIRGNCPEKTCPFNGFVFFKEFKGKPKCECFCDSGNVEDPLVLCSSITHEVPGPNIQAASSLGVIDSPTCTDLRSNCEDMKSQGMCITELKTMFVQCTKTCDFCGKGENLCIDYSAGCQLMSASWTDEDLKDLMSNLCPKSSRVCNNPTGACDIEFALLEEGNNDASFVVEGNTLLALLQLSYIFLK